MAIDHIAVIEDEGARVVAALAADSGGRIPWSDDWTVAACAHHVASVHHVVAHVVRGRPTADFGLLATLDRPAVDDPALVGWAADGTAALVRELRATDPAAECWSWWPEGRSAAFWQRRMAQETLVHRWDAELGAGIDGTPMDPAVAADGIDEHLDVFVGLNRFLHQAPAGPTVLFACTDTDDRWLVDLGTAGGREVVRPDGGGDAGAATTLRGPAEALLLTAWGRVEPAAAGVEVTGDTSVLSRWRDLFPPM